MAKALGIISGVLKELADLVATSAGAATAGSVPVLGSSGTLDSSFFPNGVVPTIVRIGSDFSTSSSTPVAVTGMSLTVPAAGTYEFAFLCQYSTAATTTGVKFSVAGPSTFFAQFAVEIWSNKTTLVVNSDNVFGNALSGSTSGPGTAATALVPAFVRGIFTATAAGTIQLQLATATAASAVTVKAGSVGKLYRLV
ncbi:MAG: hypothetical protein JWO15_3697 [Sphingomonadales bacterium]|nr:hypothetical protein [Sphingomonadales bacterium]